MWDDMRIYDTPDLSPGKLYVLLQEYKIANQSKGDEDNEKR